MTAAERALLQRIVDSSGTAAWRAVKAIIDERDAAKRMDDRRGMCRYCGKSGRECTVDGWPSWLDIKKECLDWERVEGE